MFDVVRTIHIIHSKSGLFYIKHYGTQWGRYIKDMSYTPAYRRRMFRREPYNVILISGWDE